ncbi:MAG: hypothetical protein E7655_06335 [Ruminococcaceae bacterium]|nr:hypothetical protein [Oscillospiraceae bacterium]
MKKLIALALALLALFAFAACANNDPVGDESDLPDSITTAPEGSDEPEDTTSAADAETTAPAASGDNSFANVTELVDLLNTKSAVQVRMGATMDIPAEYPEDFVGLTADQYKEYVEAGAFHEPMISPADHSMSVIQLKEGADAEAVAKIVFENCNPRKWVCMTAEHVLVARSGQYIMLAMTTKSNTEILYNAFVEIFPDAVKQEASAEDVLSNRPVQNLPGADPVLP